MLLSICISDDNVGSPQQIHPDHETYKEINNIYRKSLNDETPLIRKKRCECLLKKKISRF